MPCKQHQAKFPAQYTSFGQRYLGKEKMRYKNSKESYQHGSNKMSFVLDGRKTYEKKNQKRREWCVGNQA